MLIQISYLASHPEWISPVANWFQDSWEAVWQPRTANGWWDVACEHTHFSTLPLAYVAHHGKTLLAAAALDPRAPVPELAAYESAWLTGLFIDPEQHIPGARVLLLRKVLRTAASFGYRRVYTLCAVTDERFAHHGRPWEPVGDIQLAGHPVTVLQMAIQSEDGLT